MKRLILALPFLGLLTSCEVSDSDNNDNNIDNTPYPIEYSGVEKPSSGESYSFGVDTTLFMTSADLPGGENVAWDFSTIAADENNTKTYQTYNTAGGSAALAGTYAYTEDGTTEFMVNVTSGINGAGVIKTVSGYNLEMLYEGTKKHRDTPLNYGDTKSYTYTADKKIKTGESISDSIRVSISGSQEKLVDGWGEVATPEGSWETLRIKWTEEVTETVEIHNSISNQWSPISTTVTTTRKFVFITNENPEPVLEVYVDASGTPLKAVYLK